MSIFQRTLILTLAALVLAVGIGAMLLVTRPPVRNMPVSLAEVARMLMAGAQGGGEAGGQTPESPMPREWRLTIRDVGPSPVPNEDTALSEALTVSLAQLLTSDRACVCPCRGNRIHRLAANSAKGSSPRGSRRMVTGASPKAYRAAC